MKRVNITADVILGFIKTIFLDNDVNIIDPKMQKEFGVSKLSEVLNLEYYTFMHRPESTEQIFANFEKNDSSDTPVDPLAPPKKRDTLMALNRCFCLYTLDSIDAPFAKDVDTPLVSGTLDFWIQTSKIKFVEYLLDTCNNKLRGIRIPFVFKIPSIDEDGNQNLDDNGDPIVTSEIRYASVKIDQIGRPVDDLNSIIGNACLISVGITIYFEMDTVDYSGYTVVFSWIDTNGNNITADALPLNIFSATNTMTQRPVPLVGRTQSTGNVNLSSGKQFNLVFDGYADNAFCELLADMTLNPMSSVDNNFNLTMTLTRGDTTYTLDVVLSNHQMQIANGTENETHNITLTQQATFVPIFPFKKVVGSHAYCYASGNKGVR